MDTFLIEDANEDYLIRWCWSGKLLRKWNINIMVMKINLLFASIFTHFKVFKYFLQKF